MENHLLIDEENPLANDPQACLKLHAISALLRCPTCLEAAQAAGIERDTLWRWMREPAFQKALAAGRRDLRLHALDVLHSGVPSVIALFSAALRDPQASPACRARAAEAVFHLGLRASQSDLQRRLTRIHRALQARRSPPAPLAPIT